MDGRSLSEAWRTARTPYLSYRRGIVLTSCAAGLSMMAIGLYQTGVFRRLRDPPWSRFKSSQVAAVGPAYRPLGLPIPDALLGLVSYAATAALAGLGEPDRHQRRPWLVLLMTGKVLGDAVLGAVLFVVQWRWYREFCAYCVTAASLSLAAVGLVVPETRAALRRLQPSRRTRRSKPPWAHACS